MDAIRNTQLREEVMLEELSLLSQLVAATNLSPDPLTPQQVDEVLGVPRSDGHGTETAPTIVRQRDAQSSSG